MATVFEKSPEGYFDVPTGQRLRKEIYEPGDSRGVNTSIQKSSAALNPSTPS